MVTQRMSIKGVQDETWLGEKSDSLEIAQEIEKTWPYYQIVYTQPRISLTEWEA